MFKNMREYTHEQFVKIVSKLNLDEIIYFCNNFGGWPVFFRMSLNKQICHIPFIQPGSAIIIRNELGEILLQERTDRNKWGLPGGCQNLAEDLRNTAIREALEETGIKLTLDDIVLIDIVSGPTRYNTYPNGDIVYNNTALYLADVRLDDTSKLKGDSETKRLKFFNIEDVPTNLMDEDLINSYIAYLKRTS